MPSLISLLLQLCVHPPLIMCTSAFNSDVCHRLKRPLLFALHFNCNPQKKFARIVHQKLQLTTNLPWVTLLQLTTNLLWVRPSIKVVRTLLAELYLRYTLHSGNNQEFHKARQPSCKMPLYWL